MEKIGLIAGNRKFPLLFSQAARRTATQWTFEQHYRQLMQVLTEAARRKQAA